MTKAELIAALEGYPDDTEIVAVCDLTGNGDTTFAISEVCTELYPPQLVLDLVSDPEE